MCKTVKKVQSSATYFSSLLHFSDSSVSVKGQKAIDNNQYAFFSHIYVLSARQCTRWELARDEEGTKKCIKMMELDNLWLRAKKKKQFCWPPNFSREKRKESNEWDLRARNDAHTNVTASTWMDMIIAPLVVYYTLFQHYFWLFHS